MFSSSPKEIIQTLIEIIDEKKSRITISKAIQELNYRGFNLGPSPQKVIKGLLMLVDPKFLNLKAGKMGGIGRPSQRRTGSPNKGLVALMRQALMEGKTVEDLKIQLSKLSDPD